MQWTDRYNPPDQTHWTGRKDAPAQSYFFQVIKLLDLARPIPSHQQNTLQFALLGFACDEGVKRNLGRVGAKEGPNAIRVEVSRLTIQKQNIICYDAGDITCTDDDLEKSQTALAEAVHLLMQHNIIPIIIGGGHELAWGHFLGLDKSLNSSDIGVVNIDAHFDMRPLLANNKGTSGTPFLQIALFVSDKSKKINYSCIGIQSSSNTQELFAIAKKFHTKICFAEDFHESTSDKCFDLVKQVIADNPLIYLSIDLDVFASAYAPGVSAPQVMGLTPWQIIPYIKLLAASGKIVSYDVAELAPNYDIDQRTAKLAAHIIFEIIHAHVARY